MVRTTKTYNLTQVDIDALKCSVKDHEKQVHLIFLSPVNRLTNQKELETLFPKHPKKTVEDLILAAWAQWGTGMADKLRGSFGFAIFDGSKQSIYIARDVFGICPIYIHRDDTQLIIGSSSRLVRSLLGPDIQRDLVMLADFIKGGYIERERTFFSDIRRVQAGHWMLIESEKTVKHKYWSATDHPEDVVYNSPTQEFNERFKNSIKSVYVPKKTGLLLSGGLDSSAIAGVLKTQGVSGKDLPCLSLTYNKTENWSDAPHLKTMLEYIDVDPVEFESDCHDPLSDMEYWLEVMDGPYLSHGHSVSFRLLSAARDMGLTHVLTGHGGDEVVSYGFGRLNELAKERRWKTLWKEMSARSDLYGSSRFGTFYYYLAHIKWIRRIQHFINRIRRKVFSSPKPNSDYLSLALSQKVDVSRYDFTVALRRGEHDERMVHNENLSLPLQATALEIYTLCSEASGVVVEHPFLDRNLVEFCLSLPSEWKLRNGFSRFIIRDAMKGQMPESVRVRRDKFDFTNNFRKGLFSNTERLLELTDPTTPLISEYVNVHKLEDIRKKVCKNKAELERPEVTFLWRVAVLNLWFGIEIAQLKKPKLFKLKN